MPTQTHAGETGMSRQPATLRLELFVRDLDASLAFYTDVLGFTELEGTPSATYRPLARGAARIALQDIETLPRDHPVRSGTVGGGVEIVLEVDDIGALYRDVRRKWPVAGDLKEQPWGLSDFRVLDPDGYYWRPTSA